MKKVLLSMVAVATIAMTSCGGNELCECFEMGQTMSEEMKAADGDADKIKAITDKYKTQQEACEKAGEAQEKSMKDMDEKAQEAAMKEFEDSCPAYKKMMDEFKK
jgi:hypothetical protein